MNYLKVSSYQGPEPLMGMKLFLTNHVYKYITGTYIHTKNSYSIDVDILPNCSICYWNIKEGLPCLHQLKKNTVNEFILYTTKRLRNDYLFVCYGLEYTNRELYIERTILNREQIVPLKSDTILENSCQLKFDTPNEIPKTLGK